MHLTRCTYFTLIYFTLCTTLYTMHVYTLCTLCTTHLTRCTYFTLNYFTLCTTLYTMHLYTLDSMHFTRCTSRRSTSLCVLARYYALQSMINSVYLILCVLDPMYFSEGLCTEEPSAKLSGKRSAKSRTARLSSTDSDLHYMSDISSEPDAFMHSISKEQFSAAVSTATEGTTIPRKSKACANLLVSAGLRCSCHFIQVSHCPNVQFAPMPKPLP